MNKKLIIIFAIALSIVFTFLLSQFGSNPYSENPVQATFLEWSSDKLSFGEGGDANKVYFYLPEIKSGTISESVDLKDFVKLDENATNQKSTLKFSMLVDDESKKDCLSLIETGALGGTLYVTGQTSATITVSTTDGSGLSAILLIRPNKKAVEEHHDIGDI